MKKVYFSTPFFFYKQKQYLKVVVFFSVCLVIYIAIKLHFDYKQDDQVITFFHKFVDENIHFQ